MAVAADYTRWVRELDENQSGDTQYDERLEVSNDCFKALPRSQSFVTASLSRKVKPRVAPISQTFELQQEMKLLNWHKLANEAALKAAIIKTNKIKQEDSQIATALYQEEREERVQRAQQIIEEEQLKPLQVNPEFFRSLEAKGQRDEAKLDHDVQRHIEHLRKLKELMAQREEMQRRRQQFRDKMRSLQKVDSDIHRLKQLPKLSNQDEVDVKNDRGDTNSIYHQAAMAAGGKAALDNAIMVTSLDKLMELEQRIRNLEDAGLAVDSQNEARSNSRSRRTSKQTQIPGGGLRFSKRRATGGLDEPSRTVYAVTGATKMRARDNVPLKRTSKSSVTPNKRVYPSSTGSRNRTIPNTNTFLTSLPESKQRQVRRMTERERRNFLKKEKAKEIEDRARRQNVVIEGWLDKKRAAANQRKASTSQMRASAQTSTVSRRNMKQEVPPPPRIRAPTLGAASGKRLANAHLQNFDNIKKGFTKRKEAIQRLPSTVYSRSMGQFSAATASRSQRTITRSALIGANTRQTVNTRGITLPSTRSEVLAGKGSNRQFLGHQRESASTVVARQVTNKLPRLQQSVSSRISHRPGQSVKPNLPRILNHKGPDFTLSQPLKARSVNVPAFSRLNKR
ncbi:hypothetical protein Plhal304r1_c014g0052941 [Plasmopara halstedii]